MIRFLNQTKKYLNKEELNIALNSLLTSSKDNDIKQIRSLLRKTC